MKRITHERFYWDDSNVGYLDIQRSFLVYRDDGSLYYCEGVMPPYVPEMALVWRPCPSCGFVACPGDCVPPGCMKLSSDIQEDLYHVIARGHMNDEEVLTTEAICFELNDTYSPEAIRACLEELRDKHVIAFYEELGWSTCDEPHADTIDDGGFHPFEE